MALTDKQRLALALGAAGGALFLLGFKRAGPQGRTAAEQAAHQKIADAARARAAREAQARIARLRAEHDAAEKALPVPSAAQAAQVSTTTASKLPSAARREIAAQDHAARWYFAMTGKAPVALSRRAKNATALAGFTLSYCVQREPTGLRLRRILTPLGRPGGRTLGETGKAPPVARGRGTAQTITAQTITVCGGEEIDRRDFGPAEANLKIAANVGVYDPNLQWYVPTDPRNPKYGVRLPPHTWTWGSRGDKRVLAPILSAYVRNGGERRVGRPVNPAAARFPSLFTETQPETPPGRPQLGHNLVQLNIIKYPGDAAEAAWRESATALSRPPKRSVGDRYFYIQYFTGGELGRCAIIQDAGADTAYLVGGGFYEMIVRASGRLATTGLPASDEFTTEILVDAENNKKVWGTTQQFSYDAADGTRFAPSGGGNDIFSGRDLTFYWDTQRKVPYAVSWVESDLVTNNYAAVMALSRRGDKTYLGAVAAGSVVDGGASERMLAVKGAGVLAAVAATVASGGLAAPALLASATVVANGASSLLGSTTLGRALGAAGALGQQLDGFASAKGFNLGKIDTALIGTAFEGLTREVTAGAEKFVARAAAQASKLDLNTVLDFVQKGAPQLVERLQEVAQGTTYQTWGQSQVAAQQERDLGGTGVFGLDELKYDYVYGLAVGVKDSGGNYAVRPNPGLMVATLRSNYQKNTDTNAVQAALVPLASQGRLDEFVAAILDLPSDLD